MEINLSAVYQDAEKELTALIQGIVEGTATAAEASCSVEGCEVVFRIQRVTCATGKHFQCSVSVESGNGKTVTIDKGIGELAFGEQAYDGIQISAVASVKDYASSVKDYASSVKDYASSVKDYASYPIYFAQAYTMTYVQQAFLKLCTTSKFIVESSKTTTEESTTINLRGAYEALEAHLTEGLSESCDTQATIRYANYSVQFTLRLVSLLSWQCVTKVESYAGCKLALASTNADVKVYEDNRIVLSTEAVANLGELSISGLLSGWHAKKALMRDCLKSCVLLEAPSQEDATLITSQEDETPILCDCCGSDFGHDYGNIHHVSGTLDGENSNHIHLCADCMEMQGVIYVAITSAKTGESSKPFESLDKCYGCGHTFHNDYRNAHYYKTVMADESVDAGTLVVLCETCDCLIDFGNLEDAETKDA